MAYRTLFSAVPLLGVFLAIFTAFGVFNEFKGRILDFLTTYLMPTAKDVVIDNMVQMADNTKTLSGVSMVVTLLLALYLFNAIEMSFNRIWGITEKRGFIRKFTAFTAILLWAPVFFGLSFYLTGVIQAHLPWLKSTMEVGVLSRNVLRLLPVFFTWAALTIMYVVVPHTKVEYRAAAIGALVASLGWELVKVGFNFYVIRAVNYSKIYGSLSVIPIFIIGLYLLWVVVFLGAEIAYVLHNYRYHDDWSERDWTGYKSYLAIGVMLNIGARFHAGKPSPTLEELAKEYRVAIPVLREALTALVQAGLLTRSEEELYFPARDLHAITLEDILNATVDKMAVICGLSRSAETIVKQMPPGGASKLMEIFKSVESDRHQKLGQVKLGDLLELDGKETPAIGLVETDISEMKE